MKKMILFLSFLTFCNAGSYAGLLFHGNCITCHEIKANKSAPSIMHIQKVYKSAFTNKNTFIQYMTTWVYEPKEETSLMHDAILKYGVMPHLAYDKEVLKEISQFIYETDFNSYND